MEKISLNKIKWISSLQLLKNRRNEQLFVVEGEKGVKEAITYFSANIHTLVATEKFIQENDCSSFDSFIANEKELERMTSLSSNSSALAVCHYPKKSPLATRPFVLALDGIRDPGNLGTMIRTAEWFGLQHVVCSEDTVDCFNPKVIQSSMGSIFRVQVHYLDLNAFLSSFKRPIYGAVLNDKAADFATIHPETESVLIIGSESHGIRKEIIELVSHPVFIPGFGQTESLNAGVAAGILLHHWSKSLLA